MYCTLEEVDAAGSVWIFTFNKKISEDESASLLSKLKSFLDGWERHGKPIKSSAMVLEGTSIIVYSRSETKPSGCSLDLLYREIQLMGKELNLEMLNRFNVPITTKGGVVEIIDLAQLKDDTDVAFVLNIKARTKTDISGRNMWLTPAELLG